MLKNQKSILRSILYALFTIFIFYFTDNENIFLYVFSISLVRIFSSLLENVSYKKILKKYYDENNHWLVWKVKNISTLSIIGITYLFSFLNYLLGMILNIYLNINYLPQTFFVASFIICVNPLFHLLEEYLTLYGYKKISKNVGNIFSFSQCFFFLLNIILFFKLFPISNILSIYSLLISPILALIITYLYAFLLFYKQKRKFSKLHNYSSKINYKYILSELFGHRLNSSIRSALLHSFSYLSILFLYYSLYRIYHYSFENISNIINLTYFYLTNIVLIFVDVSYDIIKKKISNLKNLIKDRHQFSLEINLLLNRLLKFLLPIIILSAVLYKALWKLIFNIPFTSEITIFVIISAFFLILYFIFLDILCLFSDSKILFYPILVSIGFKLIMTIPLINSFYMMGYHQVFGEIFSTIISYTIGIIVCIIILNRKYQIDFVHNFPKILMLIYDNIVLTLILILSELIIPIDPQSKLEAIGYILIYGLIEIAYFSIKKHLNQLMFEKKSNS